MLALPERGFYRSITKHNSSLTTACDWLEACASLHDDSMSQSDVADILKEEEIYRDQGFAMEFVADVWLHLRKRARLFGDGYPVEVTRARIGPRGAWADYSPYTFCLL